MAAQTVLTVGIQLVGTCPLLMHNERLANPFDPITKQIASLTSKRTNKTEEDNLMIQRLEWEGGLYWSAPLGPYIPGANIKKCIMESATINKAGTAVKRAVTPLEVEVPLRYLGPRTIQELWETEAYIDIRSVKLNGRSKVLRARPRFAAWELRTRLYLNINILSLDDFAAYLDQAGATTGIGDYRPTFGRFLATITKHEGIL